MKQETRILEAFHGLVLDDGRTFTNWGLSRSTRPAVYVEPVWISGGSIRRIRG